MVDRVAPESVMIATIGGQPQVVTFALDGLLARGERVREVVVLHLSPQNPRFGRALQRVWSEFEEQRYYGGEVRLRLSPLRRGHERLVDIRDEVEADAAWNAVRNLIATFKA